jgi:Holliday junction resolvase RusA-like endonuclease
MELDEIEIKFPVEFNLPGVPVSLQSSPRGRGRWKTRIETEVRRLKGPSAFAEDGPVYLTILLFLAAPMQGDVDNAIKPIVDAMMGIIYVNDRQLERVLIRKFEPDRPRSFVEPSRALSLALAEEPPTVYIRVDDVGSFGAAMP